MCPSGATCLLADCYQNPTKRVGLANLIIISLNINLLSPWHSWKIGAKQQLLTHSLYIWKKSFINFYWVFEIFVKQSFIIIE